MARSRVWGGVLVVVLGVAGLLIALSSNSRANPLWPVWATLAVTLCGSSGLVALHGLAQWRELAAIRPLPRGSTILPTAVIFAGALVVITAAELVAAQPGNGWRGDLLVLLAVSGGAGAGAAMFGVRHLAMTQLQTVDLAELEASMVELKANENQHPWLYRRWSASLVPAHAGLFPGRPRISPSCCPRPPCTRNCSPELGTRQRVVIHTGAVVGPFAVIHGGTTKQQAGPRGRARRGGQARPRALGQQVDSLIAGNLADAHQPVRIHVEERCGRRARPWRHVCDRLRHQRLTFAADRRRHVLDWARHSKWRSGTS